MLAWQLLTYTELFYAHQPEVSESGVPTNVLASEVPPEKLHVGDAGSTAFPLGRQPPQIVKEAPRATAAYPVARLPSEEELVASTTDTKNAFARP